MEELKNSQGLSFRADAVCLVSGGMDSCVTAAIATIENKKVAFLHVSYGQLTEKRERKAFNEIADFYDVEKRLDVSIEYLAKIGGSSLTDSVLKMAEADLEADKIPTSYVPFRNANMLAIATSWAEVLKSSSIYIGAVAEDARGYPDCRPEFVSAFEKVIETGTRPETLIKIKTPIINKSKSEPKNAKPYTGQWDDCLWSVGRLSLVSGATVSLIFLTYLMVVSGTTVSGQWGYCLLKNVSGMAYGSFGLKMSPSHHFSQFV